MYETLLLYMLIPKLWK